MKKRWIVPMVIIVGFIFVQSMIPENRSANESQWFTNSILNPLLAKFGMKAEIDIVRKIAHAVEFCALSVVAYMLWKPKGDAELKTLFTGLTLAFFDESLQLLTGRGALISDIWIDLVGVGVGTSIGWLFKNGRNRK